MNPLTLKPEAKGPLVGGPVEIDRLWAPAGVRPASVRLARRKTGGRELRWTRLFVLGYVALMLALLVVALTQALITEPSLPALAGFVASSALALGMAYGVARLNWLTQPRVSRITPRVGPGVVEASAGRDTVG